MLKKLNFIEFLIYSILLQILAKVVLFKFLQILFLDVTSLPHIGGELNFINIKN